jgi:hypothetical protein
MSLGLGMLASVSGIDPLRWFSLSILAKKQKGKNGKVNHRIIQNRGSRVPVHTEAGAV